MVLTLLFGGSTASAVDPRTISIKPKGDPASYTPPATNVNRGAEVRWENEDGESHTATATEQVGFDTGTIGPGQTSKAIVFSKLGTFQYYCKFHPDSSDLKGSITVVEQEPDYSPPPPRDLSTASPAAGGTSAPGGAAGAASTVSSASESPSPGGHESASGDGFEADEGPRRGRGGTLAGDSGSDGEGGLPFLLILGIGALIVAGGAGAGLWYLRRRAAARAGI